MTDTRAGRLGDRAVVAGHIPGPSAMASRDVLINSRRALRVSDAGRHPTGCDDPEWRAKEGATHVLINNRHAHRARDATKHGCQPGRLAEGSPNVLVGDRGGPSVRADSWIEFRVSVHNVPAPAVSMTFVDVDEEEHHWTTDDAGVARLSAVAPGRGRLK